MVFDVTIPFREITATWLVPAPIFISRIPLDSSGDRFIPYAQAKDSSTSIISLLPAWRAASSTALFCISVMPEGTTITTFGWIKLKPSFTFPKK